MCPPFGNGLVWRSGKRQFCPTPLSMDSSSDSSSLDHAAAVFASVRGRLFGVAYRMLGSIAEAEDVVQDAWLRWQTADRSAVVDPAAFLVTTTTRLAITATTSARARRETYVGPWLPEPVDTSADPALGAERQEALEIAVLQLLEKLPPAERAAYVLSEAFDYPFLQIAEVLAVSEANARQLASRARKHLTRVPGDAVDPIAQRNLLEAFVGAAQSGNVQALESLLAADVVSYSDGGGAVRAAGKPIEGHRRVVHFVAAVSRWVWTGASLLPVDANGRAALLIEREGAPFALLAIGASRRGIERLFWVMNPVKLAAIVAATRRAVR